MQTYSEMLKPHSVIILYLEPHSVIYLEPHSVIYLEPHSVIYLEPHSVIYLEPHSVIYLEPHSVIYLEPLFTPPPLQVREWVWFMQTLSPSCTRVRLV